MVKHVCPISVVRWIEGRLLLAFLILIWTLRGDCLAGTIWTNVEKPLQGKTSGMASVELNRKKIQRWPLIAWKVSRSSHVLRGGM